MRQSLGGIWRLAILRLAAVFLWIAMAGYFLGPLWRVASGDGLLLDPLDVSIDVVFLVAVTTICVGLYRGRRRAYLPALLLATSLIVLHLLAVSEVSLLVLIAPAVVALSLLVSPSIRAQFWPSASSRSDRSLVVIAVLIAGLEMAATVVLGFEAPLQALQSPGIAYLTALNMCCGFEAGAYVSDELMPHWNGLTRIGVPGLFVANATVYALLLLGFRHRPTQDAA